MIQPEIRVFADATGVAREAANRVVKAAQEAIDQHGRFSLVLSGGSTPRMLYELLASDEFRDQIDWTYTLVYFGDERTVPPDHPESNYRLASETLLRRVPIPGDNVYRMRGEIDPEQAAREYGQMLQEHFADTGPDLVLLGMGQDGHTASLFPHTPALKESKHRCVANRVEKLNTTRLTLTAPFINRAAQVLILVTGADKAARVAEVLEGPSDPDRLPIQLIQPASGRLTWMLDAAAAGMQE